MRWQRSNCWHVLLYCIDDADTRLYHIITDCIRFQFSLRIFALLCTTNNIICLCAMCIHTYRVQTACTCIKIYIYIYRWGILTMGGYNIMFIWMHRISYIIYIRVRIHKNIRYNAKLLLLKKSSYKLISCIFIVDLSIKHRVRHKCMVVENGDFFYSY